MHAVSVIGFLHRNRQDHRDLGCDVLREDIQCHHAISAQVAVLATALVAPAGAAERVGLV